MNRDKTTDMEDNHMEKLNAAFAPAPSRPVRVLQFGEGNFLRAFCDWMIDIANEKAGFDGVDVKSEIFAEPPEKRWRNA